MIGIKPLVAVLALVASASFSPDLRAAVSVQGGPGSCSVLVSLVTRRWMDVRRVMLPSSAKLRRPKQEDFYCVSPYYLRNALERRGVADREVRCFSDPSNSGLGICCDAGLRSCAQLRPELVPETARPSRKKAQPSGSNSGWVTPPSDKDQWKTTTD
jgi:hypothetical protein